MCDLGKLLILSETNVSELPRGGNDIIQLVQCLAHSEGSKGGSKEEMLGQK